jgi:Fic family protein
MNSGFYELDGDGGPPCFRPAAPRLPSMDDVQDVHELAWRSVLDFDRMLAAWPPAGRIGRLFARLDAVHSSGAEGATTTFTDLMEFESSGVAPDPVDAASVAACAAALDAETDSDGDPAAIALRIHRRLFERAGDRMLSGSAGQWKSRRNGTPDRDAPGRVFYYTKPDSVPAAMAEWAAFTMISEPRVPELLRQAASHWMFEHIHPVSDGNGRIGRLLVPLVLRLKGATKTACAFFGEAVHEDKQLYVEALKEGRIAGDLTGWTRLMLSLVARTARANIERIDALRTLEAQWRRATSGFRRDSAVHRLVELALTRPAFTVNDAVRDVGGTFASVNAAARRLVAAGILSVPDDARRERIFEATAVLDLFDRFRRPSAPSGANT